MPEIVQAGDRLALTVEVMDETLIEPFTNRGHLTVAAEVHSKPGKPTKRESKPPPEQDGEPKDRAAGIDLPEVHWVNRDGWRHDRFGDNPMDRYSALRAVQAGTAQDGGVIGSYVFYLNQDNDFVVTEMKASPRNADLLKAQYQYGMTLAGMGAVRYASERQNGKDGDDGDSGTWTIEDLVAATTDALSPLLLPMIDSLGELDVDDIEETVAGAIDTSVGDDDQHD